MEQTLEIIEIISLIIGLIFCGITLWQLESKGNMFCKVTWIGITTIFFVLQILKLVLEIILNQSDETTILVFGLWTLNVIIVKYIIKKHPEEE